MSDHVVFHEKEKVSGTRHEQTLAGALRGNSHFSARDSLTTVTARQNPALE